MMIFFKRVIATIAILAGSAFSQAIPFGPVEVEKIELLKSNRDDVVRLLAGQSLNVGGYDHYQLFFMDDWIVRVDYSKGSCTDDWNVPEWIVTEIHVSPKENIPLKGLRLDTSRFRKERNDPQRKNIYVLYDKPAGTAFYISGDRAETLLRIPPAKEYSQLCAREEVTEYYGSSRWRRERKLPKKLIIDYNHPAHVTDLKLSSTELTATCDPALGSEKQTCLEDANRIQVVTDATDPEYDVLTYFYKVSGGRVVGNRANVVWDLTGVKPGIYTIVAAVDDGCGLCGKFARRSVVVK